jgi:hypothetical protein
MEKPNFAEFYKHLIIGDEVEVVITSHSKTRGVLMDKYLTEANVYGDILLDGGQIMERRPFFAGGQQNIFVLTRT